MTDPQYNPTEVPTKVEGMLADLRANIEQLAVKLGGLESAYRDAGDDLKNRAAQDVEDIHQLKEESQRLIVLLRGGSLFGRYQEDAERHRRTADRWRLFAVIVLLASTTLEFLLVNEVRPLGWVQTTAPIVPLVVLFTYASLESYNHRRREVDRRRIYLRMAAIESYIRPAGDGEASRGKSEELLDQFIQRHFIEADLDANDMNYVGARGVGPLTMRFGKRGSETTSKG